MVNLGNGNLFHISIDWDSDIKPTNTPAENTSGDLKIIIKHDVVWGGKDESGINWTWIELFEHLTNNWQYFLYEEDIQFMSLTDEEAEDFKESHNLAQGLQGLWLSDLVISRIGTLCKLKANNHIYNLDWVDVIDVLEKFGDLMVERLKSGNIDPRAEQVINDWSKRNDSSPSEIASIYTGIDKNILMQNYKINVKKKYRNQEFKPDCILAVARFVHGKVPENDSKSIVKMINRLQEKARKQSASLKNLTQHASKFLNEMPILSKPYEQGYAIANEIRSLLPGKPNNLEPIDIEEVYHALHIPLFNKKFSNKNIDAIAFWPNKTKVAVVINKEGVYSSSNGGRNATLAHELCHLLIDRNGALPLVDVVGGRVPIEIEKRARAFAAELLLPFEAIEMACKNITAKNLDNLIYNLSRRFKASSELVINQLVNQASNLFHQDIRTILYHKRKKVNF